MGQWTIRRATISDADAIAATHVRTWQAGYAGIMPDDVLDRLDPVAWAQRRRWAFTDPVRRQSTLFVAVDAAGEVIGFIDVGRYRSQEDHNDVDERVGEVYAIYVHPDHWRSGIGRALLDAGVAALVEAGRRPIRLWVLDANSRARRFYERYGFVGDGERTTYTVRRPSGESVDLDEIRYVLR
jgi:ribosomal protein S18 acetylase RimI-like enzyme